MALGKLHKDPNIFFSDIYLQCKSYRCKSMNERNMIQDTIRPNFLWLESKPGRSSPGHIQPVTSLAAPHVKLPSETSSITFSSGATCDHNCQSGCKPAISYSSSVDSLTWDHHADQV
jgi:hypothetical protein